MSDFVSRWVVQALESLNLPSTALVTALTVRDDFLIDTLASTSFAIGAGCCLDKLMAAAVFVDNFDTHFGEDNGNGSGLLLAVALGGCGMTDLIPQTVS